MASSAPLLCAIYNKRKFRTYKGFTLASLKKLIDYLFPGYTLKIEQNNKNLCFDIYLCMIKKETKEEINKSELERFQKYFGNGFNVILWSESKQDFLNNHE